MKKNSRSKNRRSQVTKPLGHNGGRNEGFNDAMMEKGRSSAASRHKSAKDYRRKPKHAGKGWD